MVRVGSLFDIAHMTPDDKDNKTGWTAKQQLANIYRAVPNLLTMKKQIYTAVMDELANSGIRDMMPSELDADELKHVNRFFKNELLPIISPILIGPNHPIPHLVSKQLYAVALLENKKGKKAIGIVPMPDSVSPVLMLPDGKKFIRTENILQQWLPTLFGSYTTKESCIICVTRNADISFDDDKFEDNDKDFRRQMKKLLKQRDHLAVVRLELNKTISDEFSNMLSEFINVSSKQVSVDSTPLNMEYVSDMIKELPKELSSRLLYTPYQSRWPEDIRHNESVSAQILQRDHLLYYPYDSVEPFLKLLNEAADDPKVLSIKITIYRLASSSRIAQSLCRAAENGKEVLVLMELRARFDEANNLAWSKMLEESGCQVIYGTEGFKCHSKICLITYRNKNKHSYITQIGTGNYNEKTNAMYTDISIMTPDQEIGEDASAFFRNMLVNQLDGEYRKLCVSPFGIKSMLIDNIKQQAKLGENGYICIKANSVTEKDIINALVKASQAGTEVQLIIRGICCILPGISGYTENVHVSSVVGRYLEHARIYKFGRGEDAKLYISSADLMTRNLNRRVEIAYPVDDPQIKEMLEWVLDSQLKDTAKASMMLSDGLYCRKHSAVPFDSQDYFMHHSPHSEPETVHEPAQIQNKFIGKIMDIFVALDNHLTSRSEK